MVKYQVVRMIEGIMIPFDSQDIFAFAEIAGYEFEGIEDGKHLRIELQGQPKFKNLCGPMWGGMEGNVPVIRYEDWDVYDQLSN